MSTGTPSKHERIERHIQRQRGAGVRSLATSFGFSFGLPAAVTAAAPALEPSHPHEPPAKRRKSHGVDERLAKVKSTRSDQGHTGAQETGLRYMRKGNPQRCVDTIAEEPECVVETEGDSFFQKRVAPKKRGRPRKVAVKVDKIQDDVELASQPTTKRRGRPRKAPRLVGEVNYVMLGGEGTGRDMAIAAARVATGTSALELVGTDTAAEVENHAEKKGRTTNKATDVVHGENPLKKTDMGPQLSRSRRRAATSAMTKVSEGFLEEESDVIKKRRGVPASAYALRTPHEAMGVGRGPRGSMNSKPEYRQTHDNPAPSTEARKPSAPRATMRKTLRSDRVMTDSLIDRDGETDIEKGSVELSNVGRLQACQPAPEAEPCNKPKRRAAVAARTKVTNGFAEEASDISKKRRDVHVWRTERPPSDGAEPERPQKRCRTKDECSGTTAKVSSERKPLAEAKTNVCSLSSEKPTLEKHDEQALLPKSQSAKLPIHAHRHTSTAGAAVKKRRATKIFVDREPALERGVADSGTDPTFPQYLTEPSHQMKGTLASQSNSCTYKSTHDREQAPLPLEPEGRKHHDHRPMTRAVKVNPEGPTTNGAPSSTLQAVQTSVNGGEVVEDVDWLFAQPVHAARKIATSRRAPLTRRQGRINSDALDMDLDDLLSNIANFVPHTAGSRAG